MSRKRRTFYVVDTDYRIQYRRYAYDTKMAKHIARRTSKNFKLFTRQCDAIKFLRQIS